MRRSQWIVAASVAVLICLSLAHADDKPAQTRPSGGITVVVATPDGGGWTLLNDDSHIDVVLENNTDKPIDVYDEWNSWGWENISLEWQIGNAQGKVTRTPRSFLANGPTITALPPGGVMVRSVNLAAEWEGWPKFKNGEKMTVRAIYDSHQAGPGWQGKVVSAPVTFLISDMRK